MKTNFKALTVWFAAATGLLPLTTFVANAAPPTIRWAYAPAVTSGFNLRFSRPVDPETATNIANYQLYQSGPGTVLSVSLLHGTNTQEYAVATSEPITGHTVVTVDGVQDFAFPPEIMHNAQTQILITEGMQIRILDEPEDQEISESSSVTFSAEANASNAAGDALPVIYQWQTNGVDAAEANAPSLTFSSAPLESNGLAVRCRVRVPGGVVSTRTARLTVHSADPRVDAYVTGDPRADRIVVNFVEAVNPVTATDIANYSVDGLPILGAEVWSNGRTVVLTTSPLVPGTSHTLRYSGIRDISIGSHLLPPGNYKFTVWEKEAGWVRLDRYDNLAGPTVAALVGNSKYPDQPSAVEFLPRLDAALSFVAPTNRGLRLTGWLMPPTTGNYDFYIAASGQALLSLSSDDTVDQLVPIAAEPEGQALRDYASLANRVGSPGNVFFPAVISLPVNRSTSTVGAIHLEASQAYAFEVLAADGTDSPYVSVVMVPEGSPAPTTGTPGINGSQVINFTNPDNQIAIEPPPPYVFTSAGDNVSLTITPKPGAQPVTYQWQRDGVDMEGATGSMLSFIADDSFHGTRFRCRLARPGRVMFSPLILVAVDLPPVRLADEGESLSVTLPPLGTSAKLQSRPGFGGSDSWVDVGTVEPGPGKTAFALSKTDGQRYFRILP